jgi:hypothetical protein
MVHALERVRPWLGSEGYILEIHDVSAPPRIEVHTQQHQFYAGQLLSTTNYEGEYQADQAIDDVIQAGIFSSRHSKTFEYCIRADSLSSLQDYLAESWENTYLTQGTQQKIHELEGQLGQGSEVVLHMISRMIILDPG